MKKISLIVVFLMAVANLPFIVLFVAKNPSDTALALAVSSMGFGFCTGMGIAMWVTGRK